jgi:hypothetical protein
MCAYLLDADKMGFADDEKMIARLEMPAGADDELGEVEWSDIMCSRVHHDTLDFLDRHAANPAFNPLTFPESIAFDGLPTRHGVESGVSVTATMRTSDPNII